MNTTTLTAPASRTQVPNLRAMAMRAISAAFSPKASLIAACIAKKIRKNVCRLEKSAYICNDFHLNKATESPTAPAAGLFYGRGVCHNTSSVPCGALMRPLPCSRWKSTGSGTFSVSLPAENINIIRFI